MPGLSDRQGKTWKKIRRYLFKFSFNGGPAYRALPALLRVPATATAPVFPVNPPGFSLEDRDRLHVEDKGNILDREVIGMQVCAEVKRKSEAA